MDGQVHDRSVGRLTEICTGFWKWLWQGTAVYLTFTSLLPSHRPACTTGKMILCTPCFTFLAKTFPFFDFSLLWKLRSETQPEWTFSSMFFGATLRFCANSSVNSSQMPWELLKNQVISQRPVVVPLDLWCHDAVWGMQFWWKPEWILLSLSLYWPPLACPQLVVVVTRAPVKYFFLLFLWVFDFIARFPTVCTSCPKSIFLRIRRRNNSHFQPCFWNQTSLTS